MSSHSFAVYPHTYRILGGLSLQSVSTTWRNICRCAPFLTTLGTHCISRSGPRSPTRIAYSPASPLSPRLPAPRHTHTQSRPSDCPIQHQDTTSTPTRTYSSRVCLSRVAVARCCADGEPLSCVERQRHGHGAAQHRTDTTRTHTHTHTQASRRDTL